MTLHLLNIYAVLQYMFVKTIRVGSTMSYQLWTSFALLCFAVVLSFLVVRYEHFIGSPDAQRCGVDMPPCQFGYTCANGYCVSGQPPALPSDTGLPVYP